MSARLYNHRRGCQPALKGRITRQRDPISSDCCWCLFHLISTGLLCQCGVKDVLSHKSTALKHQVGLGFEMEL